MSDPERHFKDEAWVDMVRGIPPAEPGGRMRQHLENQCPECIRMFRIWGKPSQAPRRGSLISSRRRMRFAPLRPRFQQLRVLLLCRGTPRSAAGSTWVPLDRPCRASHSLTSIGESEDGMRKHHARYT